MMDKQLVFCEAKSATTAFNSDAIDFGQKEPTTGLNDRPLYVVIQATTPLAADAATVKVTIEDSEDNSEFTPILATGDLTAAQVNGGAAVPMPLKHRQYVRIALAVGTTAPTAGAVTAYLSDVINMPMTTPIEGIEYLPTI